MSIQIKDDTLLRIDVQGTTPTAGAMQPYIGYPLTLASLTLRLITGERLICARARGCYLLGLDFSVTGDLSGYVAAGFSPRDASLLLAATLGSPPPSLRNISEEAGGVLYEVGNLTAAALFLALEEMCGLATRPAAPQLAGDTAREGCPRDGRQIWCGGGILTVDALIRPAKATDNPITCALDFIPTTTSWRRLRSALGSLRD